MNALAASFPFCWRASNRYGNDLVSDHRRAADPDGPVGVGAEAAAAQPGDAVSRDRFCARPVRRRAGTLDPYHDAHWLTQLTEVALLISLFSVGLRLRVAINDPMWRLPIRLGVIGMLATIALLACADFFLVGLSVGGAVLLAAMLAPTDPVLASDVQIQDVGDRDRIRFSLSGEGGLNDGTTFPFVMFGLFLLDVPGTDIYGGPWAIPFVMWAVVAGLAQRLAARARRGRAGAVPAAALSAGARPGRVFHARIDRTVVWRRTLDARHRLRRGVRCRRRDARHRASCQRRSRTGIGTRRIAASDAPVIPRIHPKARLHGGNSARLQPAARTHRRIRDGAAAGHHAVGHRLFVRRRADRGAAAGGDPPDRGGHFARRQRATRLQRQLVAWFGIRGIGSFYYLVFALQYPWQDDLKQRFVPLVLTVVAVSVLVHGVTATPLMERYYRSRRHS